MKKLILVFLLLHLSIQGFPQQSENNAPDVTPETLSQKVALFGKSFPQEKIFIHIDNTCYFIGDTIRYKAYVTRSDNHTLTNLSKIV